MQEVNDRVQMLRKLMREQGIDAYLVPTADYHESEYVGEYFKCRHFLTGFTGTAGTAVITADKAGLWTDGRYFVQAESQLSGSCVRLFRMGDPGVPSIGEFLREEIPQGGVLGFDGRVVSDEVGRELLSALEDKQVSVSDSRDLVGEIWTERPPMSCEPVWILEERFAGMKTEDKLDCVRSVMREKGCDVHLMTMLDEIAWLFNLRGGDIVNNPVFLANAVISLDEATLYIQEKALLPDTGEYLNRLGVSVKPYGEFSQAAGKLAGRTILLERKKISFSICENLDETNRIVDAMNPCAVLKAVKNPVEIENMRRVHIKDGVAVTKFMYWLKHLSLTEDVTEMTAARKIESLRAEQEGYIGPSFVTIAAYRENAAMCHYHPSDEACSRLLPEGLLLVDSGGHYLDGTTDITRTYALGPVTQEEKEYFTIVSASMLKAGDMKFLYGCRGINLDYTIREAFWKRGLDFNHGTGHGVGFVSTVHERPNGIRWKVVPERQDSAVIEPGMICSDEPGLYFEGRFGVRTENMILCVPDEKNQYGQFLRFEFLTWAPIDLDAVDPQYMDENDIRRLNEYHREVYEKISPYLTEEEREWLKEATREISK